MGVKFPSLASFLDSTNKLERTTMDNAIKQTAENEIQKILSETAVTLSVYNNIDNIVKEGDSREEKKSSSTSLIEAGIKEAVALNASRVKSILNEIFNNYKITQERELFWIDKLCDLFNIDKSLDLEVKSVLIERHLYEDSDMLNYVTFLVEASEKNNLK